MLCFAKKVLERITPYMFISHTKMSMIIFGTSWYRGVLLSIPFDGVWEITIKRERLTRGGRKGWGGT